MLYLIFYYKHTISYYKLLRYKDKYIKILLNLDKCETNFKKVFFCDFFMDIYERIKIKEVI